MAHARNGKIPVNFKMSKTKPKIIIDKKRQESQRLPFRIPTAPSTKWHKDDSKYDRKKEKSIPVS